MLPPINIIFDLSRPGTTDLTGQQVKDEFTDSQDVQHYTTTDVTETTATDPHRDTYDNLTIDFLTKRNLQYPDVNKTSPSNTPDLDPLVAKQHLPEDDLDENEQGKNLEESSNNEAIGSTKETMEADDESAKDSLALPIKDVPIEPIGSTDSVSPR